MLDVQKDSTDRLDEEVQKQKSKVERNLSRLTLKSDFLELSRVTEERAKRQDYCCKDLDNKIKTTDRYIDQFLPFRMIKEVSSFMEFLLDEDQALKIKVLKKEKIKELYHRMFKLDEVVEFKSAMKKLQNEAEQQGYDGKPPPAFEQS